MQLWSFKAVSLLDSPRKPQPARTGVKKKKSIRRNYAGSIRIDNYLKDLLLAQERCKPKEERDLGNLPNTEEVRRSGKAL